MSLRHILQICIAILCCSCAGAQNTDSTANNWLNAWRDASRTIGQLFTTATNSSLPVPDTTNTSASNNTATYVSVTRTADGATIFGTQGTVNTPAPAANENVCTTRGCVIAANYLISNMNDSADPCDDFYEYACGKWIHDNPIPDNYESFATFSLLSSTIITQLRSAVEDNSTSPSEAINNARRLYRICMNTTAIEKAKGTPLLNVFNQLGGLPLMTDGTPATTSDGAAPISMVPWNESTFDLTDLLGKARSLNGAEIFFSYYVSADSRNTSRNILWLDQMTPALGSRDYYLESNYSQYIDAYAQYMNDVYTLLFQDAGSLVSPQLNQTIHEMIQFETRIVEILTPNEDLLNATETYNKMTLGQLYGLLPEIDWVKYILASAPQRDYDVINNQTEIIVGEPEYLVKLADLLRDSSPRLLANFILTQNVDPTLLDSRYSQATLRFQASFSGASERSPRWGTCMNVVNQYFPQAIGALYVADHFTPNDKREAEAMVANLRQAFREILADNDWMDDATKQTALNKEAAMVALIGYPEMDANFTQLDAYYAGTQLNESEGYFEAGHKLSVWYRQQEYDKLKQPFDRFDWETLAPDVVDAYYTRARNVITLPAAILQPPYFSGEFPKVINYGAIGMVIGHEITHGFDDQGSQYDGSGNIDNWWSEQSAQNFDTRKSCMIQQYSNYSEPGTGMNVNGVITLGENIADNGGLKEAYRAYQSYVGQAGEEPLLPGLQHLSNNQVFFLSFANFFCGSRRKDSTVQQLLTDVHSPSNFRVIGALSNFPEFSAAYGCPAGSALNPPNKCTVW